MNKKRYVIFTLIMAICLFFLYPIAAMADDDNDGHPAGRPDGHCWVDKNANGEQINGYGWKQNYGDSPSSSNAESYDGGRYKVEGVCTSNVNDTYCICNNNIIDCKTDPCSLGNIGTLHVNNNYYYDENKNAFVGVNVAFWGEWCTGHSFRLASDTKKRCQFDATYLNSLDKKLKFQDDKLLYDYTNKFMIINSDRWKGEAFDDGRTWEYGWEDKTFTCDEENTDITYSTKTYYQLKNDDEFYELNAADNSDKRKNDDDSNIIFNVDDSYGVDVRQVTEDIRSIKYESSNQLVCTYDYRAENNISNLMLSENKNTFDYKYRSILNVYEQDIDGSYPSTPTKRYVSNWAADGENVEWNYDSYGNLVSSSSSDVSYTSSNLNWSQNATDYHYGSNNYANDYLSDANENGNQIECGTVINKYIRRKQYNIVLHDNPQNDASTAVNYTDPDNSYFNDNRRFIRNIDNTYIMRAYVGATVVLPEPSKTFNMIGYTNDNVWYDASSGGNSEASHNQEVVWGFNDPNILWTYDLYAHWCSEPGQIYLMPNSRLLGTNSNYAAYVDSTGTPRNTYLYDDKLTTTYNEYFTNMSKRAFDSGTVLLPNVKVSNITLNYHAEDGITVDESSGTTNVEFDKWTPYSDYDSGFYYKYSPFSKFNELEIVDFIGCNECHWLGFHGTLNDTSYIYNNGNWGFSKGESRNSLMVANFKGSWELTLPNAYKTGYVFTGWFNGDKYIGMAGDTIDTQQWVFDFNTGVGDSGLTDYETGVNGNLSSITLKPHFEPINYKIIYDMNIPEDTDSSTNYGKLQSHSLLDSPEALTGVHSLVADGSEGKGSHVVGSSDDMNVHYSYLGDETYTYDDFENLELEDMPITVNDYYFTGWTYEDILWTGFGGMQVKNGIELGVTRIGNGIEDVYDTTSDFTLKTLSLSPNIVENVKNNLPDTTSYSGLYADNYSWPVTDGSNDYTDKATGLNESEPTVYIHLKANWTDKILSEAAVLYNSNNENNYTEFTGDSVSRLTEYTDIHPVSDLSDNAFGTTIDTSTISSANTVIGDTSDDGSYDKNATSDTFFVNKDTDKYYSGVSNGRSGFFSFQGWSVWKFATWRDAIDSNKKDTDDSELQDSCGHDVNPVNSSFTSGSLLMRHYNDAVRSKRVGDLYYRITALVYPHTHLDGEYVNTNKNGDMLSMDGIGENFSASLSSKYWDAYKFRWQKGTSGNYSVPIQNVLSTGNITMYAIWDAYPTSIIENTYCYISDIETLTPGYLFSKVVASDYEDFWNQKNYSIGDTSAGNVDWNSVAYASANMNNANASSCPTGDYTYTYNIGGSDAYMGGSFTATLIGYDFNKFKNAAFIYDVASVSVTYKFTDSAGNTTYKTAWVYINDNSDIDRDNDNNDPDNTRYSITRFISEDFYNKASFDENGNYIKDSANESEGSLLSRSKWYMVDSYKTQLQNAFNSLKLVGGSKLKLNYANWSSSYVDENGNVDKYRLQYDSNTGKWISIDNYQSLKAVTKGIYVLDYDDILATKKFIQTNNYDTGNYTGDTVSRYIDNIFNRTAIKRIID